MASELERFVRAEHAWPRTEFGFAFDVGKAGIAAGHQQEGERAGANGQRLGNPRRLDAERFGRI